MEANIQVLEGAQYRLRVKLTNEAGEQLPPELFCVYAGAFCPGYAPARFHAERTAEEWVLTMPGLKPGRVPWNWQVIAAEYATGVEWLLAVGEVTVTPRLATGSGYVDPGELKIVATLDKTTLQMTVQISGSTEACRQAVVAAQKSAKEADIRAKAAAEQAQAAETARKQADGSATNAAVSAETAREHATAADTSATDAANSASAAAASSKAAADEVTKAAAEVERAKLERETAAGHADAAAQSAQAAMSNQQGAEQAAQDAAQARVAAEAAKADADAAKVAAQISASAAAQFTVDEVGHLKRAVERKVLTHEGTTVILLDEMGNLYNGEERPPLLDDANGWYIVNARLHTDVLKRKVGLMEEVEVRTDGGEEDNFVAYGFGCEAQVTGRLLGLELECRDGGTAEPVNKLIYLKVWRVVDGAPVLVGRSLEGLLHMVGAVLSYTFVEPIEVTAGEEIRVSFHSSDELSVTEYQMGRQCCLRVVAKDAGALGGMLGNMGGYGAENDATQRSWEPVQRWRVQAERYARLEHEHGEYALKSELAGHLGDATVHVTAAERERWDAAGENFSDYYEKHAQYLKITGGGVTLGAAALAHSPTCPITIGVRAETGSNYPIAIGYEAKAMVYGGIAIGYRSECSVEGYSISLGHIASASGKYASALGYKANASHNYAIAVGVGAKASGVNTTALGCKAEVADDGVAVIAAWDSAGGTQTLLYLIGANSPLATTYEEGAACMGYVVKDTGGNILECGTRKLSEIFTNNTAFAPASMDLDAPAPTPFMPTGITEPIELPEEPEEVTEQ